MNPDAPKTPREELELRITALLLGELSADEAAALRELMAQDQELARLHDRLKQTISLVHEAAAHATEPVGTQAAPLKLSDERREKLLAHFKTIRPKEFTEAPRRAFPMRLVELAAVLALVAILAAMLLPALSKAKSKSQRVSVLNNLRQLDVAKQQWAQDNKKSVNDEPTFDDIRPYLGRSSEALPPVAGESYVLGKVGEPVAAEVDAKEAKKRFGRLPTQQASGVANSERVRLSMDGNLAFVQKSEARQQIAGQVEDNRAGYTPSASLAPPLAQPIRTVVVLPPAESTVADAWGIAGGSDFKPGSLSDHTDSASRFSPGDESSPSRFELITQKTPAFDFAGKSGPPSGMEFGYTGVKGGATIVASGGAAGDVRYSGEQTPRLLGQGGGGGMPIESPATSDPVALSVTQGFNIAAANSANVGSLSLARPVRSPRVDLFAGSEGADRSVVTSNDQLWYRDSNRSGGRNQTDTSLGEARQSGVYSQSIVGYVNSPTTPPNSVAVAPGDKITKTDLDEKLRTKQSELAQLRAGLNIKEVDAAGSAPVPLMEAETLRSLEGLRIESETRAIAKEKLVSQLKSLSRAEQKKIIPTAVSDSLLSGPTPTNKIEPDIAVSRKPATNAPIPQPEIQTSENNFSTFSLNVSDVSFKLAMASLAQGQMPDVASIRSEEFINAFDYRDPEPQAGAPIAFAYERARYPFAHNRDLLRFSLKTAAAGRQAGRPLNIVLLLDNSGSMERADRVQIIREALRVLAGQLQPQDKLSVITFARTARLVADGVSGDKAGEVTEQVAGLTPEGGTNLEDAMNLAYQTAARHYLANGINRVVLLTDGAANLGDVEPESLRRKVEAQRKQGIALDCFGIGWDGFNDDLLEVLSRNGDGRYGFINSPEEAAMDFVGQLAGALKVAASDVKVQVEFNPKRVTSYRQIGYAKHQLTKEQFRDNTVDAAEIAAQEAGNALYTVEVNPAGQGPIAAVRVRYKVPGTTDYREQSWDVPYTGNTLSLEQSSRAMRLAASASAFSEWLVASPFAGEVTPDRVLGVLRGVPEVYGADARPKQLERMLRQAKSIAGE